MKAFLDRTLPLSSMAMRKTGDRYEHVEQADFSHLRYLMICGCGFPNSRKNFEPAVMQFKLVERAGTQYALTGSIDEALLEEIGTPMIPEEQYAAIVNGGA